MSYILAFVISVFAGWSIAACDALFRAEERPGVFRGTTGMILLLVVTGAGGLVLAGAAVWVLRVVPSATVAVIMAIGAVLGGKASNFLHVTAAGAVNRMLVGLVGLGVLYGLAWSYFPVN